MVNTAVPESFGSPVTRFPVDAHVHFHQRKLVGRTLDAALANLRAVTGRSQGLVGALLLTQASCEKVFEELESEHSVDRWTLRPAAQEVETLIARKDGAELAIVCGRQIRAEAGLEVLALGTRQHFPDGQSLAATVRSVQEAGAVSVLPWGFGKWMGRRGRLIESTLAASGVRELFVGDNGSRLAAVATPTLIRRCEQQGFRVLPGTDPFPFGDDYRRVGAFGFVAELSGMADAPWAGLREWLMHLDRSPEPFGRACGTCRFLFNQLGIQIYNRLARSAPA